MLNNSQSMKRKTLEKKFHSKNINLIRKMKKTRSLSDIYKKDNIKNKNINLEKININLYENNDYLINQKFKNNDSIQTVQKNSNLNFSLFNIEKEFKQFKLLFPENKKINFENIQFIFKYFKLLINNIYSEKKGYYYSKRFSKKNCENFLKDNENKNIFLKDVFFKIQSIFKKISEKRLDEIQIIRDKSVNSINSRSLRIENSKRISFEKKINLKNFEIIKKNNLKNLENFDSNNLKKFNRNKKNNFKSFENKINLKKKRKSFINHKKKSFREMNSLNHKKNSKNRMSHYKNDLNDLKESFFHKTKNDLKIKKKKKKEYAKSFKLKKKIFIRDIIKNLKLPKLKKKRKKNKYFKTQIMKTENTDCFFNDKKKYLKTDFNKDLKNYIKNLKTNKNLFSKNKNLKTNFEKSKKKKINKNPLTTKKLKTNLQKDLENSIKIFKMTKYPLNTTKFLKTDFEKNLRKSIKNFKSKNQPIDTFRKEFSNTKISVQSHRNINTLKNFNKKNSMANFKSLKFSKNSFLKKKIINSEKKKKEKLKKSCKEIIFDKSEKKKNKKIIKSEIKINHQRKINRLFRKRFRNPYDEFSTDSEKEFTFRKNSYESLKYKKNFK